MLEKHAQELYKLMAPIVGKPWVRIVLHGAVSASSYQFDFYFRRRAGEGYLKCYDVAPLDALIPVFAGMARICRGAQSELRKSPEGASGDVWSGFTFVLTNDGDFRIHYEYGEQAAALDSAWRERYLV